MNGCPTIVSVGSNNASGSLQDELKEYKRQLDSLKEDLEIVIRFASGFVVQQAILGYRVLTRF